MDRRPQGPEESGPPRIPKAGGADSRPERMAARFLLRTIHQAPEVTELSQPEMASVRAPGLGRSGLPRSSGRHVVGVPSWWKATLAPLAPPPTASARPELVPAALRAVMCLDCWRPAGGGVCAVRTIYAMSLSPSGCKEIERLRTGPCTLPLTHALASSPQQCSEPTLGLKLTETGGHRGPPYNGKIRGRSLERDPDGLEMRSSAQGVPSRAWKCFKGPGAGSGGRVTRERSLPPPASRWPPGPACRVGASECQPDVGPAFSMSEINQTHPDHDLWKRLGSAGLARLQAHLQPQESRGWQK
ncbi:unnamed protein product [Rangifer tarandus platyrhynchus]|uniref:Uncharacterized protein n=1 Tax=Rangifer tarandus platyrhynchus TaxID=3082113 RepID=A0ABN8Z0K4_RANTA|nr:unnamed protein product [Rangifer tarandus platyrhynchus]